MTLLRPALAALAAISVLASGCLETPGTTDGTAGSDCPAEVPSWSDPHGDPVELQVANSQNDDTCVRIFFDETLVGSSALAGQSDDEPHNNPAPLASFLWTGPEVTVEVRDEATGLASEETIQLFEGQKTYVAVWVGSSGITVRTFDSPPRWA